MERRFSQPFDAKDNFKDHLVQPLLTKDYIVPWITSLHGNRVLDASSGQGIESEFIAGEGYKVVSQDLSKSMLSKSYYQGDKVVGCAEFLPYKDKFFDGILLKDTFVFLNPKSRTDFLGEALRVLKDKGSVLIISEETRMRVWRQDEKGKMAYKETFPNNDNWQATFEDCLKMYDYSFVFQADPESLAQDAKNFGFYPILRNRYNFDSPLAKESRWMKTMGGFITELKK